MGSVGTGQVGDALARVLKGLLRPLVRAMIASGLTVPALYRILKEVYVEVAERDLARLEGGRPTDSRISVLTGVHRKDVRALRAAAGGSDAAAARRVSALATVIGRWLAEAAGPDGAPLALPRSAPEGPSFERLAAGVSSDVRPRTLLDELVRQGLARVDDAGLVHLAAGAFAGPADFAQKAHFFAHNVGDHIAAAAGNLLAEAPPYMERAVFYNRLAPADIDAIEAAARDAAGTALARLNRMARERQRAGLDDPAATGRFRFGVFFYRADEDADDPEEGGGA